MLAGLRTPEKDLRQYPEAKLRTPEGAHRVPQTLVIMADGTNPPCTKADTSGIKGKNSAQAKSRQLRVTSACEYVNVTNKGVPIPITGSFSYAVTDLGIMDITSPLAILKLRQEFLSRDDVNRLGCIGGIITLPASVQSSQG